MLRLLCASQPLRLQLAARLLTAAFSCGAAWLHATREVVAGKDDLEVIGDEGTHEAVRVADFVLRLLEDIKKHYKGAVLPGRPKKAQKIRSQTKKYKPTKVLTY